MRDNNLRNLPGCLAQATATKISTTANKAPGAKYNYETWRKNFTDNTIALQDLAYIHGICNGTITRNNIVKFVNSAQNGSCPIRIPFLATMIWGWVNRGRGISNVKKIYSNRKFEGSLKKIFELIQANKIPEAYNSFDLKYIGPAFFTKFFYFIGRALDIKPLPLILDTQVAKYLDKICKQEGWKLDDFVRVNKDFTFVTKYPKGYMQYVNSMNTWAKKLGCKADDIELYMYMQSTSNQSISKKEKVMSISNTKRLPLRAAAEFAAYSGLQHRIDNSNLDYPERRGLYMELFRRAGLWNQFVKQYWPNANTPDGKKRISDYTKAAQRHFSTLPKTPTGMQVEVKQLQIQLTSQQIQKLKDIADEWSVQIDVLAKILLCERLSELTKQ